MQGFRVCPEEPRLNPKKSYRFTLHMYIHFLQKCSIDLKGQELIKVLQPQDISINFNIPVQAVSPMYLRCDLTEIDPKHYAEDKKDVLTIKV